MSVCVRAGLRKGDFVAIAGRLPLDGPDAWMAPLRVDIPPRAMLTRRAWASDPWLAAADAVGQYRAVMGFETAEAACR